MRRIDFENGLGRAHFLSCRLQHALEISGEFIFIDDQACGRIDQTMRDPHFFDFVAKCRLDTLDQGLQRVGDFFFFLLLGLVFKRAQIEITLRDRLQFLAVEFLDLPQPPLVHRFGEHQYFNAFFLEDFEMRAVARGGKTIRRDVVNFFLAVLHTRYVIS